MYRVGKTVPPKRQILKDISLSFLPGAKIGILGLNGAGKSTVLRIMAGIDTDIDGDAQAMPNLTIGYLEQEPKLDPDQTVREAVEQGLERTDRGAQAARRGLRRLRRSRRGLRSARERAGRARGGVVRAGRRSRAAVGDRRRRVAPAAVGRQDRAAVRRREAPRRAVPAAALQTRHAAARRADEPSRRRERRVAGALPAAVPGHRRRRHPRSLLPRQRRRMDPRARPRPRHSVEGQLQLLARPEARAAGARRSDRIGASQGAQTRARMGALRHEGAASEEQEPSGALRRAVELRVPEAQRDARDLHSRRRPARRSGDRVHRRAQGLRRPAADGRRHLSDPGRRDRGDHRAQRRGEVHAVPHDRRQGAARRRRDRDRFRP